MTMTSSARLLRTALLSVALSALGVVMVVYIFGEPSDLRLMLEVPPGSTALGLTLLLLVYVAGGIRLKLLASVMGTRLRLLRAIRAQVLGLFSAAVTPAGSGQAFAISFSLQRDGLASSNAWSITLYTAVLDLFFFAWAVPSSALVLSLYHLSLGKSYLTWLSLPVGLVCLGLWYLLAFRLRLFIFISVRLTSLPSLRRWRRPLLRFLQGISYATASMTGSALRTHLALHLYTALMHLALYAIFYVLAVGLGIGLKFLPVLAVITLVSLPAHLVPTPGGSGYLEFALAYVFARQAETALVTSAVLAWRVLTYYALYLLGPVLGGPVLIQALSRTTKP
jgi:uncharacterized protein (TIRG00374 family)